MPSRPSHRPVPPMPHTAPLYRPSSPPPAAPHAPTAEPLPGDTKFTIRLPPSLASAVRSALADPFTQRPAFGTLNQLYIDLTIIWLASQEKLTMNSIQAIKPEDVELMRQRIRDGYRPSADEMAPIYQFLIADRQARTAAKVKEPKIVNAKTSKPVVNDDELMSLFKASAAAEDE